MGDLMPAPQKLRLYCMVCGRECEHFRDLVEHWKGKHQKENPYKRLLAAIFCKN